MPQHDYIIDNQLFPATRTDVNNALSAIATMNSGATAPNPTYSYMRWADTSTNPATIRQRNGANTAWVVIGTADTANWGLATANNAALVGTPTAPTAAAGTSTTQIATTAFVEAPTLSWVSVTFSNSFSNFAGVQGVQYARFRGFVFLRGMAQRSTTGLTTNMAIFNLPAGFRPPAEIQFPQDSFGNPNSRVDVRTGGDVVYAYSGTPGTGGLIYPILTGICFAL